MAERVLCGQPLSYRDRVRTSLSTTTLEEVPLFIFSSGDMEPVWRSLKLSEAAKYPGNHDNNHYLNGYATAIVIILRVWCPYCTISSSVSQTPCRRIAPPVQTMARCCRDSTMPSNSGHPCSPPQWAPNAQRCHAGGKAGRDGVQPHDHHHLQGP